MYESRKSYVDTINKRVKNTNYTSNVTFLDKLKIIRDATKVYVS